MFAYTLITHLALTHSLPYTFIQRSLHFDCTGGQIPSISVGKSKNVADIFN